MGRVHPREFGIGFLSNGGDVKGFTTEDTGVTGWSVLCAGNHVLAGGDGAGLGAGE
jgi:hypothetical protein